MDPYYQDESTTIYHGNALDILKELPEGSVRCCVTSPPYWGLRNYGIPKSTWPDGWVGCLGLEPTIEMYVEHEVEIFREVRRVLRDDGTLWLNLGDTYSCSDRSFNINTSTPSFRSDRRPREDDPHKSAPGLKPKDLAGIPWRVALALQADGWFLRCDIIWHKPNPMPESIRDRPTKSHEYIFLLSKSKTYHYDFDAIKEPVTGGAHARGDGVNPKAKNSGVGFGRLSENNPSDGRQGRGRHKSPAGWDTGPGNHNQLTGRYKTKQNESFSSACCNLVESRNKRSVWTIPTFANPDAHFATFPPDLIKPCVLAGCPAGKVVLDPFMGSGTVAFVAKEFGRKSIGIELNEKYIGMIKNRIIQEVLPIHG